VHHARYGLLRPLELALWLWDVISMDFIVDLPVSNRCSSIWLVVDRFTKMSHFIPLQDAEQKAPHFVYIFLTEIWKHLAIPSIITSGRDIQFTSMIWKHVVGTLGIKSIMLSLFYPQTDGQTERINQSLECYFRGDCTYDQDNWKELLPMAEYTYDNSLHSTVRMTLFIANYGYYPWTNWPTVEPSWNPTFQNHILWLTSIHQLS